MSKKLSSKSRRGRARVEEEGASPDVRGGTPDAVEAASGNGKQALPEFTVVGIGASAGGLEAFSQLIRALPEDCTMPIVLVQHLSPEHESLIPSLIQGTTHLEAVQATDGMTLEQARIHVIPPNRTMEIQDGRLKLRPRPAGPAVFSPINLFFRSLAQYARHRAIGIVLSGTASDGAAGLSEIKSLGGITIAQRPDTAKHDGMPLAAIATGAVDMVLSPIDIANELAVLCRHPYLALAAPRLEGDSGAILDLELPPVLALLRKATGVDFTQYKTPTIKRRLRRRMVLHRVTQVEGYLALLKEKPEEAQQLYRDILIHVTRFFREPESFEVLNRLVFPEILRRRREQEAIRIWVPGCSTGEEVYSVAISLLEHLGENAGLVPIQIFGTDVSEAAVEQARTALYPESIAHDVSKERLRRFMTRQDDKYRIQKSVRDLCIFARQDLARDPPFSKLDLIACRNVLIYMGAPLQRRVLSVFHYALKPHAFLMLGPAETVGVQSESFSIVDKRHRLYSKKPVGAQLEPVFPFDYGGRIEPRTAPRLGWEARSGRGISAEASRVLLDHFVPTSVLVDSDFQILQTRGRTGHYFELAPGNATLDVVKMAREGLRRALRETLQKAATGNVSVRREGVEVRLDGERHVIDLEVIPVVAPDVLVRHFLIVLEESRGPRRQPTREKSKKTRSPSTNRDTRIQQLEQELSASRQYLQSTIQDLEAANEELQSANEEILSSNQELQSTNEELDTAKEELQSTNEELNSLNEELHSRNDELTRVNSDLVNFLANADVAIVIISRDLKVRRFTPMAERVLNLIPGDVGRPIAQVRPNIDVPELAELIRRSIDTVGTKEQEVADGDGRRYLLRIRPYKDVDNRINGAVMVVFDIETARKHDAEIDVLRNAVIQFLPRPLVVIDGGLRVQFANEAFWRLARSNSENGVGSPLHEIENGWNFAALRGELESISKDALSTLRLDLEHESSDGSIRIHRANAYRIPGLSGNLILLTIDGPVEGDSPSGGSG